jgi:RNA polymerase sigma-70 factor (ECF subfamily)
MAGRVTGSEAAAAHDEVALVSRVASGDVGAFEALFRRYGPRLARFLARTTRGPQVVDEIVNDTMLVVWRKAATFNRSSRVSTWILGIASRRRLKALQRAQATEVPLDPEELPGAPEHDPEAQVIRQDMQRGLTRALADLPAEQREVVTLTYFEGRSYAEIAAIAGCPVNTVKTRMFHARRRLKALLAEGRRVA